MKRYVFAYDVNVELMQASKSLDEWVNELSDGAAADFSGESTWDAVSDGVLWEYIQTGDYSTYVTQVENETFDI